MIPIRMPDMSEPLPLEFFINPRCPPSDSSDPSVAATATIGEEPPTSSLIAAVDGTDMPLEPPVRMDGEPDVAVDGYGLNLALVGRAFLPFAVF